LYECIVVFRHAVTSAGLWWKQSGVGAGWVGQGGLEVCRVGVGKNFQIFMVVGWVWILWVQGGT